MRPGETDPEALLRSRPYLRLLIVVAILGAPVAAAAFWFLELVSRLERWLYGPGYLPEWLGFHGTPVWWPVPLMAVAGILTGAAIRFLPGRGGHSPAAGFHTGSAPALASLPGIAAAALSSLAFGAVLGPEAPLIALGGGLAAGAARAVRRNLAEPSVAVIGAAGSFSAVSTLLGSPLAGAFLLMEASGLGGPMLGPVLVPGLLAAGIGTLTFVGFDAWTGFGTFSLAIPHLPAVGAPDAPEFGWAVVVGLVAAVTGGVIRRAALWLAPQVEGRILLLTPVAGLAIAGAAVAYAEATGRPTSEVLFSGQAALPGLVVGASGYASGTLALLLIAKAVAYVLSLGAFRGGPTFPAMFLGAAGGILLSHLPGLPEVAGAAIGIGAMTCAVLGLPLTSVLLTTLFMGADGLNLMPLVIVAVVVAYVGRAYFPTPRPGPAPTGPSGDGQQPAPESPVKASR